MRSNYFLKTALSALVLFQLSCTSKSAQSLPGSNDHPLQLYTIFGGDAKLAEKTGQQLEAYLHEATGYSFKINVPKSADENLEAFKSGHGDLGHLTTFKYLEAQGAVEAALTTIRDSESTFKAQIIALSDGPIKRLEDLNGKKVAFVNSHSVTGFLLPSKLFKDKNINPAQTVFAQNPENVVTMVYKHQVDAGAIYAAPSANGQIQDARRLLKIRFADVEQKIGVIGTTDSLPRDPLVFRKGLPTEMKSKIVEALLTYVKTEEGQKVVEATFNGVDLKKSGDSDYDQARSLLKDMGKDPKNLVP